ncbi:MAG: hypothetical protein ACK4RZ_13115, partial [Paracoccaceae bacterium]
FGSSQAPWLFNDLCLSYGFAADFVSSSRKSDLVSAKRIDALPLEPPRDMFHNSQELDPLGADMGCAGCWIT